MARFFHHDLPLWWRKGSTVFLAISWLIGLISGVAMFFYAGNILLSQMRGVLYNSVSIVSLLCVTTLPFLFSAFAVFISEPRLLLLVSIGKAFQFSFTSMGILAAFPSAGWLIRWLLMFSDLVSVPVLYWFWQRHIAGNHRFSGVESLFLFSLFVLIASVDYCCISPFLANLIYS